MAKKKEICKITKFPAFDEAILQPEGNEALWAVKIMPKNEFRFRDYCDNIGIVNYLPLRKNWKLHSVTQKGRTYTYSTEILRPMFPSYAFVKCKPEDHRRIYDSKVLLQFLDPGNQTAFLEEIHAVRVAEYIGFHEDVEVHTDIPVGARFLIQSGVWEGVTGWLYKKDDLFKWTIALDVCGQYVTATIDPTLYKMTRLDE